MSITASGSAVIECKVKRPGGSLISMSDGTEYRFSPDTIGRHVCVIDNMEHITRFMQIPDYALLQLVPSADAPVAPAPLHGPAAVLPEQSSDGTGGAEGGSAIDRDEIPAADADGTYSAEAEATIRTIFKAELGRVAPPKSKPETMVAQIESAREARGV